VTVSDVAILGLGEAGSMLARDLAAAGVHVRGFDPAVSASDAELAPTAAEAVRGAYAVLSLNAAAVAVGAAEAAADGLGADQLFADLNTAAPAVKRAVAAVVGAAGAVFADVALMGPVPRRGLRTPALASGPGAERFAQRFGALGMPVTVVGDAPGDAAARKLARSVFAKGLAASVGEALAAARALDCEDWMYGELERTLTEADAALLRRLIEGSRLHAGRRREEMAAAVAMLDELGVEPRVASASEAWLAALAEADAPATAAERPR
jgi:3-hydroxyisobutyrate dehydrogenase-like beta-hydroxyacid dehydrogenase